MRERIPGRAGGDINDVVPRLVAVAAGRGSSSEGPLSPPAAMDRVVLFSTGAPAFPPLAAAPSSFRAEFTSILVPNFLRVAPAPRLFCWNMMAHLISSQFLTVLCYSCGFETELVL